MKKNHLEVSSLPVILNEVGLLKLHSGSVNEIRSPLFQLWIVVAGFYWNPIQGWVSKHPERDNCKSRKRD